MVIGESSTVNQDTSTHVGTRVCAIVFRSTTCPAPCTLPFLQHSQPLVARHRLQLDEMVVVDASEMSMTLWHTTNSCSTPDPSLQTFASNGSPVTTRNRIDMGQKAQDDESDSEMRRDQDEPLPQRPPSARLLRRSEAPAAGGSALAAARALAPPVQPSMVLQGGLAAALPRERVPLRPGAAGSKVSASLLREDVRPGMRQPSRP